MSHITHCHTHTHTHTHTLSYTHTHTHTHTHTLLTQHHMHTLDFYEEMLALLDLFTTVSVSEQMWPMLEIIYETFTRDGYDYFTGKCVSNYQKYCKFEIYYYYVA